MTTTPTLALEKQARGTAAWDLQLNSNLDKIDNLASGATAFSRISQAGTAGVSRIPIPVSQTNFINNQITPTATGSVQQVALSIELTGIATGGANVYRIPLFVGAQTGGGAGANGIIGLNMAVQQNSADDVAFINGFEFAFNNLKRDDPLNPVDQNHYMMTLDAYGGHSIGPACLAIRSAAVSSNWQRGIWMPANSITPTTGYAFDYEGNGTNGPFRVTEDAKLLLGTTTVTNMVGGDLRLSKSLWIGDGVTAPTQQTGFAVIYVDVADGDLKIKFGDGVTKTIVVDT